MHSRHYFLRDALDEVKRWLRSREEHYSDKWIQVGEWKKGTCLLSLYVDYGAQIPVHVKEDVTKENYYSLKSEEMSLSQLERYLDDLPNRKRGVHE